MCLLSRLVYSSLRILKTVLIKNSQWKNYVRYHRMPYPLLVSTLLSFAVELRTQMFASVYLDTLQPTTYEKRHVSLFSLTRCGPSSDMLFTPHQDIALLFSQPFLSVVFSYDHLSPCSSRSFSIDSMKKDFPNMIIL